MGVSTENLTAGPGTYWDAPFGAAEPTLAAVPGTGWTDVGGTSDGITLTISEDFIELEVDQVGETPERRRTKREVVVKTNLAETTLENLALSINEAAPAEAAAGEQTLDTVSSDSDDFWRPPYRACLFDGPGPNGDTMRVIARKTLSTDGTEFAYKKDGQNVYSISRTTHFVSSSVRSILYKRVTAPVE